MTARKKRRRRTQPEAERLRPQVLLRLHPDVIARLDVLAERYGSRSAAVEALVAASTK